LNIKYRLLSIDGVVAVGYDRDGLVVYVRKGFRPSGIPEGVKVKEMDTLKGYFTTLSRVRPVVSGLSVAHYKGTAGTLGGIARNGRRYLGIGANHVLALRWGTLTVGREGDPVIQPGPVDGGKFPDDYIGRLLKWSEIRTDKPAKSDSAVFEIDVPAEDLIPEVGRVYGTDSPKPGDVVKKFGRTSLLTFSKVEAVDVAAKVHQWGTVVFDGQFLVNQPFAYDGDSGSLILNEDNKVVGMVVAGNSQYTLASEAKAIEEELGIKIYGVNRNV